MPSLYAAWYGMERESGEGTGRRETAGVEGNRPAVGGGFPSHRRNPRAPGRFGYTRPCEIIARATLMNPAMFAPTTKLPGDPNSSAASAQSV